MRSEAEPAEREDVIADFGRTLTNLLAGGSSAGVVANKTRAVANKKRRPPAARRNASRAEGFLEVSFCCSSGELRLPTAGSFLVSIHRPNSAPKPVLSGFLGCSPNYSRRYP